MSELELDTRRSSAAARSKLYGLLALALEYPEGELAELVGSGELAREIERAASELDARTIAFDAGAAAHEGDVEALQTAYSALFDHGVPAPPLALNEAALNKSMSQMKLFEDLQRFYEFVGLEARRPGRESPDWLPLELEAMHYLAYREASEPEAGEKLRALQTGLFARHVRRWIGILGAGMAEHGRVGFYRALGELIRLFGRHEAHHFELAAPPERR